MMHTATFQESHGKFGWQDQFRDPSFVSIIQALAPTLLKCPRNKMLNHCRLTKPLTSALSLEESKGKDKFPAGINPS